MNVGDKKFGFAVKEIHTVKELCATMYVMEHTATGARLVYLDRDDENKTFSVAFKTLPSDSTGVFHILEHSVLCGSEKYDLKDPFVELLGGSLNTFLNAMTFGDKTMYPVASTSEEEFLNLADVYLDAVFNPLAVKRDLAFMQEGWHYEILDGGALSYKGVVLNEMRGDYSSPESVTDRHISEMLFAGTCYEHDSGGDPSVITDLTFEDFCSAHRDFYHPSNATFFLDGSMDIDKPLSLISSYLEGYGKISLDGEKYVFKRAEKRKEYREAEYEIAASEDKKNKLRLAIAHLTFRFDERKKIFGAAILSSALLSSNESELKKKIITSGLCEDLQINVGEGIYENYFEVDFINVKDGSEKELKELFYSEVKSLCERGINKAELTAAINSLEFSLRERDYGTIPLGVVYAMNLMESYLYSDDALSGLTFENEIKLIREAVEGSFFEDLLREIFIDNESAVTLLLRPVYDLSERYGIAEGEKLLAKKAELGEKGILAVSEKNRLLSEWQESPDSEEKKAKIKRLTPADIKREVKVIPADVSVNKGVTVLTQPIATSGIAYTELYFDVSDISEEEIFTSALLSLFLGNLDTEKYTARELVRALKSELGGFGASLKTVTRTDGEVKVYFKAFISALSSKKESARELVGEILTKTRFEDSAAMENMVKQAYIAGEESFSSAGHRAARARAAAMLFTEAAAVEYYSGYEAHLSYKKLSRSFAQSFDAVRDRLYAFTEKYFTRERLTVSLSENDASADSFTESLADIFRSSGIEGEPKCKLSPLPNRREGIRVPAKVGYSSTVVRAEPDSVSELGIATVAANLVSYEYLWGEIRVKGGAYGAGMNALRTGQISFYSYRDPSPKQSVNIMKASPDYLISAAEERDNIDKYIIGAIGDTSPYMTPRSRAAVGTQRFLARFTDGDRLKIKEEILSATPKALADYARKLKAAENRAICIVAPTDKLDGSGLDIILEI